MTKKKKKKKFNDLKKDRVKQTLRNAVYNRQG